LALIKRKTRLEHRRGAGGILVVDTKIVITFSFESVDKRRYRPKKALHNDFTIWKFSYNCNEVPRFV
jgi:hypothetical protein